MSRPLYKCPKCRARCVNSLMPSAHRKSSTICIADDDVIKGDKNSSDYKMRIWAYMKPPKNISEPLESVSSERLEMIRTLLDSEVVDKPVSMEIDSTVNLQLLADGTLHKKSSRTEKRVYRTSKENAPVESLDFSFEVQNDMCSTRIGF